MFVVVGEKHNAGTLMHDARTKESLIELQLALQLACFQNDVSEFFRWGYVIPHGFTAVVTFINI